MRSNRTSRRTTDGFTLVELMFAVAIIGVLAAIAVPQFWDASHRARLAEAPLNAGAIHMAEVAYEAANDQYVEEDDNQPRKNPDKRAVSWQTGSRFDKLGWSPDGAVRCVYKVEAGNDGAVKIEVECDTDGDSENAKFHIHFNNLDPSDYRDEWKTPPGTY